MTSNIGNILKSRGMRPCVKVLATPPARINAERGVEVEIT